MKFLLLAALLLGTVLSAFGQANVVKTVHDAQGWKLQVDGQDFAVKGVVWSYTPPGENYTYDLWAQPDSVITQTIDTDMTLMKAMGVNAIRVFSTVPTRWVEYIYDRYGIYTMVNDLFGRYGVTVDGRWQFPTDYSNPDTRKALLDQAKKTFETYKNTRGVLMYMLGNESNYGLEWTSTAIQNLPGGERAAYKAKALYSLFEEAFRLGKSIDSNRPMGLINGDLQYLNVMKAEVPDLDILGVNTYRGARSYSAFYNSISKDLNRPFVYTELGADAYNVATEQEDQDDQAKLIESQWQEIYQESYGKGKAANALGGFVFEWMDEWWKNGMETGLSTHDTAGTWNNGAYEFDSVPGKNNMNEEWFGILGMSLKTDHGVNRRLPRTAYYLLKDLWRLDLYTSNNDQVTQTFDNVDFGGASRQGNDLALRDATTDPAPTLEVHGSLTGRTYLKGDSQGLAASGASSLTPVTQWTAITGATIRSAEGLTGSFKVRFLPSQVANNPSTDLSTPVESAAQLSGTTTTVVNPIELYQATVDYQSKEFSATVHYHDGHADWAQQGDFFGILPETFDLYHEDLGGSVAPFGIEMSSSQYAPGLTIYAGPEIYWGANPSVIAKYSASNDTMGFTIVHDEELSPYMQLNSSAPAATTDAQKNVDRWTSLDGTYNQPGLVNLETGLMLGRYDRINSTKWTYTKESGDTTTTGLTFTLADSLAAKIKLTSDAVPYLHGEFQYIWAGPLADTHAAVARNGSQLYDSGSGNRSEVKASLTGTYGDFYLTTTGLFRVPLIDALGQPGEITAARSPLTDSFTVWDNRKAVQGELVLTWDKTGATYFHDWNNADREDSPLAASLGFLYNFYLGATDETSYTAADGINIYASTAGLPEVSGTYSVQARIAGRPVPGLRVNVTGQWARQQSTGLNSDNQAVVVDFWKTSAQVAWYRVIFEGTYANNTWGPYDWDRQFGISYPSQWSVGVAYGLKPLSFLTDTDRIGVRFSERTFGSATPTAESNSGALTYRVVAELYAGWSF